MTKFSFPEDFLWGSAVSAHQTEGQNTNNDWWAFEHSDQREAQLKKQGKDPADYYSGEACDFYHRYKEDFTLAKNMGHNTIRLGVEWSRIEPTEGNYDQEVLEHYKKMLQAAQASGLKIFLTLHHYTLPIWFSNKGGFLESKNIDDFVRYSTVVAQHLGQWVDFWITINEPEVYTPFSYILGTYPPGHHSVWQGRRVAHNLISAHKRASLELRALTNKPVSMAFQLSDIQPSSFFSKPLIRVVNYFLNDYFISRTINDCDFIGVNYYFHHHIGWLGERRMSKSQHEKTDLNWGIHPEGLERLLMRLHHKYHKPMYITENGIADAKDKKRESFIKSHLKHIHHAMDQGADVRGYLYWSLLDNFEWLYGYGPRFGLVEIDREHDLKRTVRPSALAYAEICKTNSLEI